MADNDGRLPDRLETVNNSRFPYSIGNYLYPKGVPPNGGVFMCPSSLTLASGTSCLGASLGNSNENGWLSYGFNAAVGYMINGVSEQYRSHKSRTRQPSAGVGDRNSGTSPLEPVRFKAITLRAIRGRQRKQPVGADGKFPLHGRPRGIPRDVDEPD